MASKGISVPCFACSLKQEVDQVEYALLLSMIPQHVDLWTLNDQHMAPKALPAAAKIHSNRKGNQTKRR